MQTQKVRQGYKIVESLFGKYEEIPKDWNFVKLDNVATIQDGNWILEENYATSGVRLLQVGDIGLGKFIDKSWKFISKETAKELRCKIIQQEEDILISRMPDPIGRACLSPKLSYDYIVAVDVSIVKPKKEIIPSFLIHYLNSKSNLDKMQKFVTGTTRQRISRKNLEQTSIALPPKTEQQKIASILSNVDSLINQTQKKIEQTQRLKKGLMQRLLTKGIGHTKFKKVKSYFGKYEEIPDDWDLTPLGNLCEIRKKNNVQSNLYIGLEHIGQGTNSLTGQGDVEQFTSTKNVFRKGDVLYGKLRPLLNKVWLSTEDGFCSTDILPITTKERLDNRILEKILSSDDFVDYATSSSAGTKMPRTNWSDIQKYEIKLPPIPEQQKIASILSNIDSQIQKQQEYKSKLESLKKGLMQKLLTGQIRVKA